MADPTDATQDPPEAPRGDASPLSLLRSNAERARAAIAELDALFPQLTTLSEAERRHSDGRFRPDEARALFATLEAIEHAPEHFDSLADLDEGDDPDRFETQLLRERLERREIYVDLAGRLEALARKLQDTALVLGEQTRPVLMAAFHVAKGVSRGVPAMRDKLGPALEFYARPSPRSADDEAQKVLQRARASQPPPRGDDGEGGGS